MIHSYSRLVPGQRIRNFIRRLQIDCARRSLGKKLVQIAVKEDFDLVILYHVPAAFMYAGMELDARKIRYIHGNAKQDNCLKSVLDASAKCINQCDLIICVSQLAKQAFEDVTGIHDRISVCYNPIDSEKVIEGAKEKIAEALPNKYNFC